MLIAVKLATSKQSLFMKNGYIRKLRYKNPHINLKIWVLSFSFRYILKESFQLEINVSKIENTLFSFNLFAHLP